MTLHEQLNPQQREAVETLEGPVLVLAGAGSGKTRVVTFRIVNLLEKGIPVSKILALTFTNKAANEMKERVHHLTRCNVLICTFHSLGARILRESIQYLGYTRDFHIYDESDTDKVLKSILEGFADQHGKLEAKEFRIAISHAKNRMLTPEQLESQTAADALLKQVYTGYQEKLKEYNALDYDDLLLLPVKLFREHPEILAHYQQRWSHLLIDEYQDTNAAQYTLVRQLVDHHHNLCVVGDPDQSIYSWRGADISNILNFEKDYSGAKVIRLDKNYRSRNNILQAANALIANNQGRYQKHLWSDLGEGEKILHYHGDDEKSEAIFVADRIAHHHRNGIPLNQMVVFYRTNAQSRIFEDRLLHMHIPYVIIGGVSFYQRREIKDILAWLRMIQSGSDYIAFERTLTAPKRGLGDTTIERLREGAAQAKHTLFSYCESVVDDQPLPNPLKLTARQKQGLSDYVRVIRTLREMNHSKPLPELVMETIELTGYKDYLLQDPDTAQDRQENVDALIAKAFEWHESATNGSLSAFLEELSLKSSLDDVDANRDRVNLMTIHNGKGLEFTTVFLAGMEEDLFPHINARGTEQEVEEERRLCYVGVTRAKEYLYLSEVSSRFMWGVRRTQRVSRFLREIPPEHRQKIGAYLRPTSSSPKSEPPPEPTESEAFATGDMVFHTQFGVGQICSAQQENVGLTYVIRFMKDHAEKTLVAKYANLKRL